MGGISLEQAFEKIIKLLYSEVLNPESKETLSSKDINNFLQIFLVDENRRIPYTLITKCVFEDTNFYPKEDNNVTDKRDNIEKIIDEKIEFVDNNIELLLRGAWNEDLEKVINKIGDHIKLAIIQRDYIRKNVSVLDQEVDEARRHVQKIGESKAKIYAEFVSILGIFTGIVIGIMGSLQTISSVFSHIGTVSTGKLLVFTSLTGIGVITIIVLLMKSVSNIVIRTFNINRNTTNLVELLVRNYVYFFSVLILLYFFILGGLLYFKGLRKSFEYLFGKPIIPTIVAIVIPIFILGFALYVLNSKKKKINSYFDL